MAKRTRFSVRWDKGAEAWVILSGRSEFEGLGSCKEDAVARARALAKADMPSQLRVFNKNGRIAYEYTYGRDPRRFAG